MSLRCWCALCSNAMIFLFLNKNSNITPGTSALLKLCSHVLMYGLVLQPWTAVILFCWCHFACVSLMQWGVHVSKPPSNTVTWYFVTLSFSCISEALSDNFVFVWMQEVLWYLTVCTGKYLNGLKSVKELTVQKYSKLFFIGECPGVMDKLQNVSWTEKHP